MHENTTWQDRVQFSPVCVLTEGKILYARMLLAPKMVYVPFAVTRVRACNGSLFNVAGSLFVLCLCSEGAASPCSVSHSNPKSYMWKPGNSQCSVTPRSLDILPQYVEYLFHMPKIWVLGQILSQKLLTYLPSLKDSIVQLAVHLTYLLSCRALD